MSVATAPPAPQAAATAERAQEVALLDPRYRDAGCAYFSSCLGCHLVPCAEERGGASVAMEMLRLLRHNESEFSTREPIGPPPELAAARSRRAARQRRNGASEAPRPRDVRESAARLGISRRTWYRRLAAGRIPDALLPEVTLARLQGVPHAVEPAAAPERGAPAAVRVAA